MQLAFDFGGVHDLAWIRERLRRHFGAPIPPAPRTPIGQLVKSLISSRTRDEVSLASYDKLVGRYGDWPALKAAPVAEIEGVIAEVTFADVKARDLSQTLRILSDKHPDYDLDFLAALPVPRALASLEVLPGVGRKVAASTLNFSTLQMPAFVIDTHVMRVLRRFGFVRDKADIEPAYQRVMEMAHDWSAADLTGLHVLVKRLGQLFCRPGASQCGDCPLRERCAYASLALRT
jgi:endonuclease-3